MRIVSLLPSATEITYALGLEDQLYGVTFECDEPARAREEKQIIVGGMSTAGVDPATIDRSVRDRLAAGEDLYTLDAGALGELQPDLILTQDLCAVCAVPTETVRDAAEQLGCHAEVVTLDPYSLDEVIDSIGTVARAAGVPDRGSALMSKLGARLDAVAETVRGLPRSRVAVIEWIDPPFGAGHWMPDMVTAAGGQPVACRPRQRSAATSWPEIAAARPEILVISPCGFDLAGAVGQAERLLGDPKFVEQFADAQLWAIDADGIMVRPGPRLVDGVEALAAILHPEVAIPQAGGAIRRVR
ncbi:ABC transporter substrate-binding protein [Microlunatus sp. Gsoil 973]|jgi:iron complex transport system substrate-binding protein|uniref:ABC transporter substrate-binding protein n=1 Tax=Microlunatus sp. Gsoil 973 TaxID=2672569 RepID=UPI0012B4B69B|nr:ABC transporter substrate-binding protein [Microlunatus sp. Gsoil 973]QGN35079.1 ABC transporter substrate-binding protein [Microlunatus sp. Gsoil 973]